MNCNIPFPVVLGWRWFEWPVLRVTRHPLPKDLKLLNSQVLSLFDFLNLEITMATCKFINNNIWKDPWQIQIKCLKQINNLLRFNFLIQIKPQILYDFLAMRISILVFKVIIVYLEFFDKLTVELFRICEILFIKCYGLACWVCDKSLNMHCLVVFLFQNVVEDLSWDNANVLILR